MPTGEPDPSYDEASAAEGPGLWRLLRQDDNGNRFVLATFASRSDAEAQRRAFEARGHKQTYWVEPTLTPA